MRVEAVDTSVVELPLPRPIGTAIHRMESVGCVLVRLRTTDGAVGESFVFTLNSARIRAFEEMVRGLTPLTLRRDVRDSAGVGEAIWAEINPTGHKGVTIAGLAAIDVAMWDAYARTLDQPLAKLFGGARDTVDTYASSSLWLSDPVDDLVADARRFVDAGFRGMKIRVGGAPADDEARVRAVRDAIGPDIDLYADANQGLMPKQAIALGRRLAPYELAWLEEPTSALDLAGHARVRDALDTPIASGETEYTHLGMHAMLEARACDVLMPDLQRVGGFTEFRRTAALARARHVPVSSHFFTEYSLTMAGSLPSCTLVEHIDWFAPLFDEEPELVDGRLVIPDRPGTGFTFRRF